MRHIPHPKRLGHGGKFRRINRMRRNWEIWTSGFPPKYALVSGLRTAVSQRATLRQQFELRARVVRLRNEVASLRKPQEQSSFPAAAVAPDGSARRSIKKKEIEFYAFRLGFWGPLSCVQQVPALPVGEQGYPQAAQAQHAAAGHDQRSAGPLSYNESGNHCAFAGAGISAHGTAPRSLKAASQPKVRFLKD
jgi:hypothetical protein